MEKKKELKQRAHKISLDSHLSFLELRPLLEKYNEMFKRPAWMDMEPPPGYVAGIGRGASGFTTRADIGPARAEGDAPDGKYIGRGGRFKTRRGRGRGGRVSFQPRVHRHVGTCLIHPDSLQNNSSLSLNPGRRWTGRHTYQHQRNDYYSITAHEVRERLAKRRRDVAEAQAEAADAQAGDSMSAPLFVGSKYDAEDRAADAAYAAVEARMAERHKKRTAAQMEDADESQGEKVQAQFSDAKRALASVSMDEWAALPEIGDRSIKRRVRHDWLTPAPDTLLDRARSEAASTGTIDPTGAGASSSSSGAATNVNPLTQVAEARGHLLQARLNAVAGNSGGGTTTVNPSSYMSGLASSKSLTTEELDDQKKARLLLQSVTKSNPAHGPGWIALARLEEVAGNRTESQTVMLKGTRAAPDDEDVWIEAIRLHDGDAARALCKRAVTVLPHSERVWLAAVDLEKTKDRKIIVLRKALEVNPTYVALWKAAVEQESDVGDAIVMLGRAVECVPQATDLWLALAKLESYDRAKSVLNDARKHVPTDHRIWVAALQLEEAQGAQGDRLDKLLDRSKRALLKYGVTVERETWIDEAKASEVAGSVVTAGALLRGCLDDGLEGAKETTWLQEAAQFEALGHIGCARAVLDHALAAGRDHPDLYMEAIALERRTGDKARLEMLLQAATEHCGQVEVFWLMHAKERVGAGDVPGARTILASAFAENPSSEQVYIAAAKLEFQAREVERARGILAKARDNAPSARVWMKSAWLEREVGASEAALKLVLEGIEKFPSAPKLWMMAGQLKESLGAADEAKALYDRGIKATSGKSADLWIVAAELERKAGTEMRARSLLEKARLVVNEPRVWVAGVQLELMGGHEQEAQMVLAGGLKDHPKSGDLLALWLETSPKTNRRQRAVEAMQRADSDGRLMMAVAMLFWSLRQNGKARSWFARATAANPRLGDAWAAFWAFELEVGTKEAVTQVEQAAAAADPVHGALWTSVSKAVGNGLLSTIEILRQVGPLVRRWN